MATLRPLISKLSALSDLVRGDLVPANKVRSFLLTPLPTVSTQLMLPVVQVQGSLWAEVSAHHKRVLADAMYADKSGRPLMQSEVRRPFAAGMGPTTG